MSAFDELQRQLADSVAARDRRGRAGASAGLRRWWRVHAYSTALRVAMPLLLLAVAGVATFGKRSMVRIPPPITASAGAAICQPCRATDGRLHGPLSGEAASGGAEDASEATRTQTHLAVRWTASPELPSQTAKPPVG